MRRSIPVLALAGACAWGATAPRPALGQAVRARGIDSLDVRANVQVQLNTTSVDEEPSSAWEARRARIGLRAYAAGWILGYVEADFGRGDARLTDAYARLDFAPAFRVRAGQYKKAFDALELVSSRELLVVERDGSPRGADGPTPNGLVKDLGYSDRDLGAEWSGRFAPFTATAGFFNGSGGNEGERDDGKQLAARLAVDVAESWSVAAAWSANRLELPLEDPPVSVLEDEWVQAVELAVTGGEYLEPGWKALGQAFFGDNFDPELGGGEDASFAAVHGIAGYHFPIYTVPYLIGVEPVVRVGWADPDTDADDDEATLWTAGLNVYSHRQLKTQTGVDILDPAQGGSEAAFRLMLVLEF